MTVQEDIIKFVKLEERFTDALEDDGNRQILFSGPFGSGKTTFLRSFFEKYGSDYEAIHIFPINYALHTNTDVYEILKFDLILELISRGGFDEVDISRLVKYIYAVSQTGEKAVVNLISLFSKTGKGMKQVVDLFASSYEKSSSEYQALSDPLLSVRSFSKIIEQVKGYEYQDYITSVIKEKLDLLCNGEKKKVLIVDDLDRIDPEHLFRIISIFSAHIDHHTNENKFGFDKILFVGDIQNVQGMFQHKFGLRSSFNAFISKLSSKNPFNFDPEAELYRAIPSLLSQFKFDLEGVSGTLQAYEYFTPVAKRYCNYLVCSLINLGSISLREIQKNKNIPITINGFGTIPRLGIEYHNCEIYILIKLFKALIPNTDIIKLISTLETSPLALEKLRSPGEQANHIAANLSSIPLSVVCYSDNKNSQNIGKSVGFAIAEKSLKIEFYVDDFRRSQASRLSADIANEKSLIMVTVEALTQVANLTNE